MGLGKLFCLGQIEKNMQHTHGIIQYMLEFCTSPVVHLLLLKSSMSGPLSHAKTANYSKK